MASGGVRVEGLNKLVRELQALGVDLEDLKDTFATISSEGARRAASHVRSRSGRLAASVRGNRAKNKAIVRAGRAAVPYAGAINYGWPARRITAQGFMQKADDEMRIPSVVLLEKGIRSAIKRKGLD